METGGVPFFTEPRNWQGGVGAMTTAEMAELRGSRCHFGHQHRPKQSTNSGFGSASSADIDQPIGVEVR